MLPVQRFVNRIENNITMQENSVHKWNTSKKLHEFHAKQEFKLHK